MPRDQLDAARFVVPLRRALRVGDTLQKERRGWILRVRDVEGRVGYGEWAPLPGLHPEATVDATGLLDRAAAGSQTEGDLAGLPTSLRFALDMAQAGLAEAQGRGSTWPHSLPVAGLVDEALTSVERAPPDRWQGTRALKVKVGRRALDRERAILAALDQRLPEGVSLRLDGNRRLDEDQAASLVDGPWRGRLEYLEEPFPDPETSSAFALREGVGIALDETLHEVGPAAAVELEGVRAWVVKPTLVGGREDLRAFLAPASNHPVEVVCSATFETWLGLAHLARWAARRAPDTPAGLGTWTWLGASLAQGVARDSGGRLRPEGVAAGAFTMASLPWAPTPDWVEAAAWIRCGEEVP